jgi:hypothetical protein
MFKLNFKNDGHKFKLQKGQKSWDLEIYKDGKLVLFDFFSHEEDDSMFYAIQEARAILRRALC